jgi:HK97 family phage prohead protease
MKLKFKNYKIVEPKINDQGIIEAFVSVFGNVDSYGEIIDFGAFRESLAAKLPKGVWSHNWDQPIAKTLEAREIPAGDPALPESIRNFGGLYIKGQLVLAVQKAAEALALLKEKVIDEFSIGYNDEEAYDAEDGRHLKRLRLYEWSPVLVGANPLTELINVKGAVPYADHGVADENAEWDGPAQVQACEDDLEKLKEICAWFDSENADVKASYKLPHHQVDGMKAVWKGVAAAMGALLGGRGGVDIPEADRQGVYNHLAKHYKQFEKEVPEMKKYSEQEIAEIEKGIKPAPETGGDYVIIRVRDPGYFDPDSFRTIDISTAQGIKATIGCKKGEYEGGKCNVGTEVQRYLFDKDKWTIADAEAWVEEHKKDYKPEIRISKSNLETIRSAISSLTEVLKAETEADNQGGGTGRTPLVKEGGNKKISVALLNKAVRELLKIKKSQ